LLKFRPILVEIKCPRYRAITHAVPPYYLPQVQMLLWICDLEEAHFVQYRPPTLWERGDLDVVVVKRDRQWMSEKLPVMLRFCDEVDAYNALASNIPNVVTPTYTRPAPPPAPAKRRRQFIDVLDVMESEAKVKVMELEGDDMDAMPLPKVAFRRLTVVMDEDIHREPGLVTFDYDEIYRRTKQQAMAMARRSNAGWTWEPDRIFESSDATKLRKKCYKPSVTTLLKNRQTSVTAEPSNTHP